MDWILVAQDGNEYSAEVEKVIKLWVPKTVEKLLNIQGPDLQIPKDNDQQFPH